MTFVGLSLTSHHVRNAGLSLAVFTALAVISLLCSRDRPKDQRKSLNAASFIPDDTAETLNNLNRTIFDNLENTSIPDILMPHAEAFLRAYVNNQRRSNCSMQAYYAEPGVVQYLKKISLKNASFEFALEVVYGVEVFYARIDSLSSPTKAANAALQIITTIPGPCDTYVQQQLATSALGISHNISLSFKSMSEPPQFSQPWPTSTSSSSPGPPPSPPDSRAAASRTSASATSRSPSRTGGPGCSTR